MEKKNLSTCTPNYTASHPYVIFYSAVRTSNPYGVYVIGVVVLDLLHCWTSAVCFDVTSETQSYELIFRMRGLSPHISTTCSNRCHHFVKRGLADRVVTIAAVELRQAKFRRRAHDGTTVSSILIGFKVVCRILLAQDKVVRSFAHTFQ